MQNEIASQPAGKRVKKSDKSQRHVEAANSRKASAAKCWPTRSRACRRLWAVVSQRCFQMLLWPEGSHGSEPDLLSRALAQTGAAATRNRFAGGMTYTTLGKLSVTAEYQYNGFALDQSSWSALGARPATQVAYLLEAQRRQELAPRNAYLIYVTQKSLLLKNLDLTAFLRVNAGDHSQLVWAELRHHWPSFDLAFQLQRHIGSRNSEFGILPDSRIMQVLGSYYF